MSGGEEGETRDEHVPSSGAWLATLRSYLLISAGAHLAWETLQLPLYSLWQTGSAREIALAILHCSAGDVLISTMSLVGILLMAARGGWPAEGYVQVGALTVAAGLAYTIFSEWLNTEIRGAWAYADIMPVVPLIGTGIAPLLQWIVVPSIAFRLAAPR